MYARFKNDNKSLFTINANETGPSSGRASCEVVYKQWDIMRHVPILL